MYVWHHTDSEESKRSREVHLDESPPVEIPIEHPSSLSEVDDDTLWYSRDQERSVVEEQRTDITRFSLAFMRITAAQMTANKNIVITDDHRIQMLGLESYIPPAVARSIALNRTTHRASVLNEQERQDRNNIYEADALRSVSERYSRSTSQAVYQLAVRFSNIR